MNVVISTKVRCYRATVLWWPMNFSYESKSHKTIARSRSVSQTVASCVQELMSVSMQATVRRSILDGQVTERVMALGVPLLPVCYRLYYVKQSIALVASEG